jgi:hypothetical protein
VVGDADGDAGLDGGFGLPVRISYGGTVLARLRSCDQKRLDQRDMGFGCPH